MSSPVRDDLLSRTDVNSSVKLLWLYFRQTREGAFGEPFGLNNAQIRKRLGMGQHTIDRCLAKLESLGYITWQRTKGGGRTHKRYSMVTILVRPNRG